MVYYISRQGYQEGPHSLELIEDKINSGYFTPTDYIYDALNSQWVLMSNFKETAAYCHRLDNKKNQAQGSSKDSMASNHWYLLRGNNQSGPYEYREIVIMLQNKNAFEYDFVWSPLLPEWEKISECKEFLPEKMKPFLNQKSKGESQHFRRKSPRVGFGASVVVHNNKNLWNCSGFEVSAGGASIEISKESLTKGTHIVVHFRPAKEVPAFNVHCEVMSCQKIDAETGDKTYRLGLKFLKINKSAQKIINQLVSDSAA